MPATIRIDDLAREAESRGFEGALHRMLRNEAYWFVRLGAAIERADNTARLLDVKYHLLLPKGARVGGPLDRDQWTTILQVVSAVTAYRWIYPEGLKPWLIADLLIWRREMPRSLAACVSEVVEMPDAQIEPVPEFGTAVRRDFIRGIGKRAGRFVILLEPAQAFDIEDMARLCEAREPLAA